MSKTNMLRMAGGFPGCGRHSSGTTLLRVFVGARSARAFSLIEIVLAVGIVSVALMAIFGMFSVSLRSSSETISQHEVLGATRAFNDFLRSTNAAYGVGFANVSNWLASGTDPGLYCYTTTNGFTNSIGSSLVDSNRSGRLYRMVLALSSNSPGIASMADVASSAFIPLQVKVYSVPGAGVTLSNLQPVLVYDTAVAR